MKCAVAARISALPGRQSEVEHADANRGWIADVMAFREDKCKVAFEVQLFPMSEDDYVTRSQRYCRHWRPLAGAAPALMGGGYFSVDRYAVHQDERPPRQFSGSHAPAGLPASARSRGQRGRRCRLHVVVAFPWAHGSPLDQIERYRQRQEQLRAARRLAEEKAEREAQAQQREAERESADFCLRAQHPSNTPRSPTLTIGTRTYVWCSVVSCHNGHRVLAWHAQSQVQRDVPPDYLKHRRENDTDVRTKVGQWLKASKTSVPKAQLTPLKNPNRALRAFSCPTCSHVILQRHIAALPPEKWLLIANLVLSAPDPSRYPHRKHRQHRWEREAHKARDFELQATWKQTQSLWRSPEVFEDEQRRRENLKAQRAAEKEAIRQDPRYRNHGKDWRCACLDCGGEFEDYQEGIHADSQCISPVKHGYRSDMCSARSLL